MMGRRWAYAAWMMRGAVRTAVGMGILWVGFFGFFSLFAAAPAASLALPTRIGVIDESGRLATFAAEHVAWPSWVDAGGVVSGTAVDPAPVLHQVRTGRLDGALWLDAVTEVDGSARWVTRHRADLETLGAMGEVARSTALSGRLDRAGVPGWALSATAAARLDVIIVAGPPPPDSQLERERAIGWLGLGDGPLIVLFLCWLSGAGVLACGWILLSGDIVRAPHLASDPLWVLPLGHRAGFESVVTLWMVVAAGLAAVLAAAAEPAMIAMDYASSASEARWLVTAAVVIAVAASGSSLALVRTARAATSTLAGPGWASTALGTTAAFLPMAPMLAYFAVGVWGAPALVVCLPVLGAPLGWAALSEISTLTVGAVVLNATLTVAGCYAVMCHLERVRDMLGDLDVWIDERLPRRWAVGRDEA